MIGTLQLFDFDGPLKNKWGAGRFTTRTAVFQFPSCLGSAPVADAGLA
ncbi:hypothetical protein Mal65_54030 [Crateriforma conspicua]|nr:hypothetical protein Mal65_54030 [Crateriforma conspicua]